MTAHRLRTAAAKLREVAEGATPGPWSAADEHELLDGSSPAWCVSNMRPGYRSMSPTEGYIGDVAETSLGFAEPRDAANARYIATMSPPVALAMADLLDDLAGQSESCIAWDRERETGHLEWAREPADHPDLTDAIAVANAVLNAEVTQNA